MRGWEREKGTEQPQEHAGWQQILRSQRKPSVADKEESDLGSRLYSAPFPLEIHTTHPGELRFFSAIPDIRAYGHRA